MKQGPYIEGGSSSPLMQKQVDVSVHQFLCLLHRFVRVHVMCTSCVSVWVHSIEMCVVSLKAK